jgi:hypothetical protein
MNIKLAASAMAAFGHLKYFSYFQNDENLPYSVAAELIKGDVPNADKLAELESIIQKGEAMVGVLKVLVALAVDARDGAEVDEVGVRRELKKAKELFA